MGKAAAKNHGREIQGGRRTYGADDRGAFHDVDASTPSFAAFMERHAARLVDEEGFDATAEEMAQAWEEEAGATRTGKPPGKIGAHGGAVATCLQGDELQTLLVHARDDGEVGVAGDLGDDAFLVFADQVVIYAYDGDNVHLGGCRASEARESLERDDHVMASNDPWTSVATRYDTPPPREEPKAEESEAMRRLMAMLDACGAGTAQGWRVVADHPIGPRAPHLPNAGYGEDAVHDEREAKADVSDTSGWPRPALAAVATEIARLTLGSAWMLEPREERARLSEMRRSRVCQSVSFDRPDAATLHAAWACASRKGALDALRGELAALGARGEVLAILDDEPDRCRA